MSDKIQVIEENVRTYINHVYTDYLLLPDRELKVLLALKSFAWNQKEECYPSLSTICSIANKKRRQLIEILQSLDKKGLIRIEPNSGSVSRYYITNKCLSPEKLSTDISKKKQQPVRKSAPHPCGNPHQGSAEIRTLSNIKNITKEKEREPLSVFFVDQLKEYPFNEAETVLADNHEVELDDVFEKFYINLKKKKKKQFTRADFMLWLRNEITYIARHASSKIKDSDSKKETRCAVKEWGPGHEGWESIHGRRQSV